MKFTTVFALAASMALVGCASVDMAPKAESDRAKQFSVPASGQAGLYVYRDSVVGQALKKDIWVNGKCVGESAPNTFFYEVVEGNKKHTISTESEFSPNNLELMVEAGKNYFVRQYIKLGLFVGGAGLEVISEPEGKEAIKKLEMAKPGKCSAAR